MTQPLIAAAMGGPLSTVNQAHMAYDHGGVNALKPRPSGGRKCEPWRRKRPCWRALPRMLEPTKMLNIHDLKAAYENAIGHKTSKSTIYNLLGLHGWTLDLLRLHGSAT